MPQLSITLLGTFRVAFEDQPPLSFATEKASALLAYVAVEAAQPHRRESLATLLWPDQPESRARQNLRQALSYVRQTLHDTDTAPQPFLLVDRDTIQFNRQSNFTLDVLECITQIEAIRRHRHACAERCLPCVQRYQQLAMLYRGDFLAHFFVADSELYEEWALLKREWLRRLALEAFTVLGNYHERRGEWQSARAYAQRQVEMEPWNEEAHRQLMRLLACEGQRSAAMAQYERCRQVLRAEFGATPTAETTRLFEHIRNGDATTLCAAPAPLPRGIGTFVGREAERAELAELLARPECRLITVTGPGGIGKSRLALQVAEEQRGLFAHGVAFVPLAAVTHSAAVALAIAHALHLSTTPHYELRHLLTHLCDKTLLLVLDNFEHLLECCDWLSELLRVAPSVILLVTSQERLRLQEEWLYPLQGLSFPEDAATMQAPPETYAALALFQQRAQQVASHFTLHAEVLPHVVDICRLVEGLPLGVELAAATVGEQSCAEIAAALQHTFDALESPLRDATARHRSLRAAFEHAWELLTEGEQACLTAVTVFTGSFDKEAAAIVAGASERELAALTAKSLLLFDGDRYAWHEVTHQYAAERLAARPAQAKVLRSRHSAVFAARLLELVAQLEGGGNSTALERDRRNFKAAWEWAVAQRQEDLLNMMCRGMGLLYRLRGPAQEGIALFAAALEQLSADANARLLMAELLTEQVQLLNLQTRYEHALDCANRLIVIGQQLAVTVLEGRGYFLCGQTYQQQGKHEAAQAALYRALTLLRSLATAEATRLEADVLRELGNIAARGGERAPAQHFYTQALTLYRQFEDRRGESAVLNNLGTLFSDSGAYAEARAALNAALMLYRALGNLPGEAKALNNLANIAADQREYGLALEYYQAALQIHRALQNAPAQSTVLNNLGALYWELGLYVEARDVYQQALTLHRESQNLQAEGETLANLSLVELRAGDLRTALRLAQRAVAAATQTADLLNLANAYTYLGKIHAALEQFEAAEKAFRQALLLRETIPHAGRLLELHAELAHLAWQRGALPQAMAEITPVLAALETSATLEGAEEPYQVYWICTNILRAAGDARAEMLLQRAGKQLLAQAAHISDPVWRQTFLENVPVHRWILAALK